jgi:hypothetical protein
MSAREGVKKLKEQVVGQFEVGAMSDYYRTVRGSAGC